MNNISSPRNDDAGIEAQLQSRGLTGKRVTPEDLENNIDSEHYFTAADGVLGAETASEMSPTNPQEPLGLLTFCVLVLKNGFTVTGESACVSPANFDADIGKRIARQNAIQKVWPLMGYALKEQIHQESL